MCFSAAASFTAAGVIGALGAISMARVRRPRELALAAMPVLFAMQQAVEGWLWLSLAAAPQGPRSSGLTLVYLVFARGLWPLYVPITALLIEPDRTRRRVIWPWLALGAGIAAYLLWTLFTGNYGAHILGRHIAYVTSSDGSDAVSIGYLAATTLPLLLSSRRTLVVLGVIVLVGCVVAYAFYFAAFVSVWCFFAAAASAVILGHFARERFS